MPLERYCVASSAVNHRAVISKVESVAPFSLKRAAFLLWSYSVEIQLTHDLLKQAAQTLQDALFLTVKLGGNFFHALTIVVVFTD